MYKTRHVIVITLCCFLFLSYLPSLFAGEDIFENDRMSDYEDFWREGEDNLLSLQEPVQDSLDMMRVGQGLFESLQDSLNVRRAGRGLFEPLEAFCIDHDTCYVISGKDIVLYDVSDETAPVLLSSHRITIKNIREVHSRGSYIYLTAQGNGFWMLDKTNNFKAVGWYIPGGSVTRAFIEDGKAYLACDTDLHIVDVTQLGALQLLGTYDVEKYISMPYVTGDTCYIASISYGLMILDVSDPTHIVPMDSLAITDGALKITVRDTLTYLNGRLHLTVANVRDLANVFEVGRLDVGYTMSLTDATIELKGNLAMLTAWYSGIHLIDITDPGYMFEVGNFSVEYPTDAEFSFPYVFVTNEEGLRIIDFSTPQEPELVSFVDGDHLPSNLETYGDLAYICDWVDGEFYIMDISDRTFPRIVNSLPIYGIYDVAIEYPLAYVGSRLTGFYILDVSNPDSIVQVGHSDVNARGVFIKYPYAYLSIEHWDQDGLKVLDISKPDSIVELGYYPIQITYDLFVQDTVAYIASSFDGVYIINVKNPEQPTRISRFPTYDIASDVHVSGNYLYVAAGYAGVSVVDVNDPSNPVEVAYSTIPYGNQVHVVEPYLYVSGQYRGLRIFDITEPEEFYEVGNYTGIFTEGICADEEYVYLGTTMSGFYIFEFTPVGIKPIYEGETPNLPKAFTLSQNYPNPFNPTTTISFDIPEENKNVKLSVYDLRGRHVATLIDSDLEPGNHKIIWDGRNDRGEVVSSGVYFYTIKTGDHVATRKMTVVR